MPTLGVLNEVDENENEMDSSLSEEEKNTKKTFSLEELSMNIDKRKQML